MIKTLFLLTGASFVLSVVCFAGAAALGGGDMFHRHWDRNWNVDIHDGPHDSVTIGHADTNDGPAVSRDIAWSGADSLDVQLPADVTFTQAPGPGKLTITGPKSVIDHVVLHGSELGFDTDDGDFNSDHISVVMTAPAVRHFAISGDGSMAINNYSQDDLQVDVSGHGDINAKGVARSTKLQISGDGDVDLSGLKTDSTDAEISGSGRATIAPANAANLSISGSGEIDLLSHPAQVSSDVSGSGRIVEGQAPAQPATPAAPAAPAQPLTPPLPAKAR